MAGARNRAKMEQKNAIGAPSAPIRQTRLSGSWLLIARAVWLVLVVSSLGLFVAGLPLYYQHLQRPCIDALTCNVAGALTTHGLRALVVFGLSVSAYAALNTIFWASIVVIWSGIGFLLFWRRSDEWFPLLAAFALVIFNITYPGLFTSVLSIAYPALDLPVTLMSLLGQISIALLFLLFPNGRLVPRWTGLIVPLIIIQAVSLVAPPIFPVSQSRWPTWINGLLSLAIYGTIIFSQIHRYIRVSNRAERQQTKWVAFAITTVALGFLVLGLLFTVLFPQFNQPDTPYTLITLVYPLLLLLLPVSAGVAILRYRLWDIDIIIKRTLVYGLLTTFVVGFYVLAVGYLGVIFRTNGNLLISLIATGIVAVVFQPLRAFLQRAVNRLLYGLRDEPYAVLAGLGQRLQATLAPDAILSTIVVTVREALKLSYAAIELKEGDVPRLTSSAGIPPAKEALRLPLVYQGESVGTLLIAPRGRDEELTPADFHLLDDLTRQIGIAVHTVRLTGDLQALTRDLQRSREHLVTAREEERRRLRRDLHDGLGPMLSAVMLKVGLVRTLYQRDLATTDALLNQLESEIELVIADIRRLVYNLRPPALDELGLSGAIREYADRLGGDTQALKVTVETPASLPVLPAAVEVAAYRIVQEAVTNVIRHARAHMCRVRLLVDTTLHIEVQDDGTGFEETHSTGVGLLSMRERAEELGGSFTLKKNQPCGTVILAHLPLLESSAETSARV